MRTVLSGTLLQYQCHIGHILTAETMVEAQFKQLEATLSHALVALKERAELCRQLGEMALAGTQVTALKNAEDEALARAAAIKDLLEREWARLDFYDQTKI